MKIKTTQRSFYRIVLPAVVLVALLVPAGSAPAQAILKVSDTVNFRFGMLLQPWADWQQLAGPTAGTLGGYQQNLFIRRARILFSGNLAKGVSFFMDTENANLGKSPKNTTGTQLGTGFQLLDAYGKWEIAPEFAIEGGLILIPLCRNCNESAASQLTLDYGSYSFQENGPTQSTIGRDTGFQIIGWLLNKRLEYRAGAYQGARLTGSKNAFRFTGRLAYNFLDNEYGLQFYPGTYLAAKKVLAIGTSYDTQKNYAAYAFDFFYNQPIGKNALTLEFDYINYNPGFLATAAFFKQQDITVMAGFYFGAPKLLPFARYEHLGAIDTVDEVKNQERWQAGMTYYPFGHNLNFRFAYSYLKYPNNPANHSINEYTIQMQIFYF